MSVLILAKQATPNPPSAGKRSVYLKTDGFLYTRDEAGVERSLASDTIAALGLASVNAIPYMDTASTLKADATKLAFDGTQLNLPLGQIKFPATQNPSADANTLDDYEEGTFTPTIVGSSPAGVGTYVVQAGFYTKIGNRIFIQLYLNWSAHTGGGVMSIANLPFAASGASNAFGGLTIAFLSNVALAANNIATVLTELGEARASIRQYPVGGGGPSDVTLDTAGEIVVSGSYFI